MELRQLEIFVSVADHLSMRRAAEALKLSQPSISARIQTLEDELGAPVFDRLARGVSLTEIGRAILPHARNVLKELESFSQTVDAIQNLVRGHLSIGTVTTISSYLIPTVIKAFRERFPSVSLGFMEARSRDLILALKNHRIDLAVISEFSPDPDVSTHHLFDEEVYIITSPTHPLADRGTVNFIELKDYPFVVLDAGFGLRSTLTIAATQAGFNPIVHLEMESLQAVKGLVEIGLGISLAPRPAIRQELILGTLRAVRPQNPRLFRPIQIVTLKDAYISPAANAFRAIFTEYAPVARNDR